jgi:hypothetical protein
VIAQGIAHHIFHIGLENPFIGKVIQEDDGCILHDFILHIGKEGYPLLVGGLVLRFLDQCIDPGVAVKGSIRRTLRMEERAQYVVRVGNVGLPAVLEDWCLALLQHLLELRPVCQVVELSFDTYLIEIPGDRIIFSEETLGFDT